MIIIIIIKIIINIIIIIIIPPHPHTPTHPPRHPLASRSFVLGDRRELHHKCFSELFFVVLIVAAGNNTGNCLPRNASES